MVADILTTAGHVAVIAANHGMPVSAAAPVSAGMVVCSAGGVVSVVVAWILIALAVAFIALVVGFAVRAGEGVA